VLYQNRECLAKAIQVFAARPGYALRSRAGCRGDGGLLVSAPANLFSPRSLDFNQLTPNQRHAQLVDVKCCEGTRPRSQHKAANRQHSVLCQHPWQAAGTVSLHTILLGVVEPLKASTDLEPFKTLGLKLKLHAHSVQ